MFVLFALQGQAQNPSSGIIIGSKFGSSGLLTEVTDDFRQHYTEFDNKSGFSADLELSKLFLKHFEAGMEVGLSKLKGTLDDPSASTNMFSVWQPGEWSKISQFNGPLSYSNQLREVSFFVGYYFRDFTNIDRPLSPEPFVRFGAGVITYNTGLWDNDPGKTKESTLIFGKGMQGYLPLSTAFYSAAAGVKSYISPAFFINITYTINYTPYAYLDAVHNFYADGTRIDMGGIYSELKFGLYFQPGSGKRSGNKRAKHPVSLPFSR